jgi:nucleoside 2-deoxyribosyltransferase
VAWETGFAYALQIPVLALWTDFRRSEIFNSGINFML